MLVEPETLRVDKSTLYHLTYCTNIHPGNGWSEVFANLQRYVPALKARFAPHKTFGIGLRLSGRESSELLQGDHLQQFQDFLQERGLYVFTLNGFPYGPFHQQPVKALVHAPDWRDEERVAYTLRLIEILAFLLPNGIDGSISTSPLSYKAWINMQDTAMWRGFTRNIVRIAEVLVRVKHEHGKFIHLAIEPEPDGLLENSEEVVRFYTNWLLEEGAHMLSNSLSISRDEARSHLLEHIRICFDTCHVAVAYEAPETVLERFDQIGIKVGKVQISSALKVAFPDEEVARADIACALEPFAESTYLHQVVQRNHDGSLRHYPDLIEALPYIQDQQIAQWRIHFHVPIFIDRFPRFQSTQDTILDTLDLLAQRRFCRHLEIETYTWSVLPDDLKKDLGDSIAREYKWVLSNMV
jgi:hypothetical protein